MPTKMVNGCHDLINSWTSVRKLFFYGSSENTFGPNDAEL